ncbi:MAG: hypothetical protein ACK4ON_13130, partial [Bacteroidia bacterium]
MTGTYTITGGTIELNGAGAQTLRGGRAYANLTFSNSGTKGVTSAPTSITGTLTIADDVILNTGTAGMGGLGTNLTMTGNAYFITGGSGIIPHAQGTYTLGSGTTIEFSGSSATDVRVSGVSYYNVIVSGTNVGTTGTGTGITFQSGGSFLVKNGATFRFADPQGFSGSALTAINNTNSPTITLETGSTINYNRADNIQTITSAISYPNLTISGGAGAVKTLDNNITVLENLNLNTFSTGALADAGFTINLAGNITGTGTHSGSGKILMTGNGATISGATLGNVELNNASGFSLSGSPTINGTLTFTNGKLSLGANNLTINSTTASAITGYDNSKYVVTDDVGLFRRNVVASTTYDFPIGTSTNYELATITTNAAFTGPTRLDARFENTDLGAP